MHIYMYRPKQGNYLVTADEQTLGPFKDYIEGFIYADRWTSNKQIEPTMQGLPLDQLKQVFVAVEPVDDNTFLATDTQRWATFNFGYIEVVPYKQEWVHLFNGQDLLEGRNAIFSQEFLEAVLDTGHAGINSFLDTVDKADRQGFAKTLGQKARVERDILRAVGEKDMARYLYQVAGACEGFLATTINFAQFGEVMREIKERFGLDGSEAGKEESGPIVVYDYDRTVGSFQRIFMPESFAQTFRGAFKDFMRTDPQEEKNQYYDTPYLIDGSHRLGLIVGPRDATLVEAEKPSMFDIGYFVSPTEWVHVLNGEELLKGKVIFREPFLHRFLFPDEQTKNNPWDLVQQGDESGLVSALNQQATRELIVRGALREGEFVLGYLRGVQTVCRNYGNNSRYDLFETRIRKVQNIRNATEGVMRRKEARG